MSSKKKRSAPSKEPEGPRPKRAKKGESSKTSEPKVIPRNLAFRINNILFAYCASASKLWNALPQSIRTKPSLKSFKTSLKAQFQA